MLNAKLFTVDNQEQLDRCVKALMDCRYIGLDIETAYYWLGEAGERISTLQLAAEIGSITKVWVIDLFVKYDYTGLACLLDSKEILKVIHNASYDARKVPLHMGMNIAPVWCTQTVERKLKDKAALIDVTHKYLGIKLEKETRLSDWGARPLTQKQLIYAATDAVVAYRNAKGKT